MLISLKAHYELILFTAAKKEYADVILNCFEGHQYFDHILTRKDCLFISEYGVYLKDLIILQNGRSLSDMVLIDNKVESYASHIENGVPITDFLGDYQDSMLVSLQQYLLALRGAEDVRQVILRDFCLEKKKIMDDQSSVKEERGKERTLKMR